MNKTVLELDLVGYSNIAAILEENTGPSAVAELNAQVQSFIDRGLSVIGALRKSTVLATTGDGAILLFDKAAHAHRFAATVHEATRVHNSGKTESSARRLFRMGAATGDVIIQPHPDGGTDMAGVTIARAVRLEAAARPGELLVDTVTFDSLPPALRKLYAGEEKVRGKRTEEFSARRCVMNPEVPAQGVTGHRSKGLTVALHQTCVRVLSRCWEFKDRSTMEPLFGIEPLHKYARALPIEARSQVNLIDQIIHTLVSYPAEKGQPLIDLLVVLREKRHEEDAEREDLNQLINQVRSYLSN
jgi:class 3 adenylate cyclase